MGDASLSSGSSAGNLSVMSTTLIPDVNSTQSQENVTVCSNEYCDSDVEYVDQILDYVFPNLFEWCLMVAYLVVFVVGMVGNFLVCWAVWRNQHMRTVTNYFVVNLALADLLVILLCLPPSMLEDVTETWYMGSVMCKIVKYIQAVSVAVSVLTLSCISVERWYAICFPLLFRSTPCRAKAMILVIWLVSMLLMLPELIVLDTNHSKFYHLTILLTSCRPTWDKSSQAAFQLFITLGLYVLPFGLMFVTYIQIARCLWSNSIPTETSRDPLHPANGSSGAQGSGGSRVIETQLQARRKVAKMLIAVVVMFGVCYLPVHLLNILRYLDLIPNNSLIGPYSALVAHWLCYFNSAINPVIYNFMSVKFRKEFRSACACCTRNSPDGCCCCTCCCCCEKSDDRRGDTLYSYRYSNTTSRMTKTEKVTVSPVSPNARNSHNPRMISVRV